MKLKDEIEVRNQELQVLIDASLELAATCSGGYTWMKELVERDEDFIWQKVARYRSKVVLQKKRPIETLRCENGAITREYIDGWHAQRLFTSCGVP